MLSNKPFQNFISTMDNHIIWRKIYKHLGSPRPFDVTLRDGLQNVSKENMSFFSLDKKKDIYNSIINQYKPISAEIGSIVSPNVLPIFKDSTELFDFCEQKNNNESQFCNHYLLIPNRNKLKELMLHSAIVCNNFSFITSVSNSFQQKNTKKTLKETKVEIESMIQLLCFNESKQIKLYISCINQCPLEGKIHNDTIVQEILQYNCPEITNICLSDTMGTLEPNDFTYIVDKCDKHGIPYSKLSLHLHVQKGRVNAVKQIFHEALDRKMIQFDVSALETGGCSVTMQQSQLAPNLSYEQYYTFLMDYLEKH